MSKAQPLEEASQLHSAEPKSVRLTQVKQQARAMRIHSASHLMRKCFVIGMADGTACWFLKL